MNRIKPRDQQQNIVAESEIFIRTLERMIASEAKIRKSASEVDTSRKRPNRRTLLEEGLRNKRRKQQIDLLSLDAIVKGSVDGRKTVCDRLGGGGRLPKVVVETSRVACLEKSSIIAISVNWRFRLIVAKILGQKCDN